MDLIVALIALSVFIAFVECALRAVEDRTACDSPDSIPVSIVAIVLWVLFVSPLFVPLG